MIADARAAAVRRNRPRGVYVPTSDVPAYLACGWRVLDQCVGRDEVLLLPPAPFREAAA